MIGMILAPRLLPMNSWIRPSPWHAFYKTGMPPPSRVVPGVTGSVLLEWQFSDGTYGEVEIVEPFYAEVMMIQPGHPPKHWTLPTDD